VSIHLIQTEERRQHSEHTSIYIFVSGIDEIYEEFLADNTPIKNQIGNRDYGMRDFDVKDPYILAFGETIN